MSKSKGITVQQQSKSIQNGRPQQLNSSSMTKGTQGSLDEFKYGFPSDGLAVVSYKWWGSSSPNRNEDMSGHLVEDSLEDKRKAEELVDEGSDVLLIKGDKPQSGDKESNSETEGAGLLRNVRKRAAKEGKEALRLGVYRGYGLRKLGKREKILLLRIFGSSLPSHWRYEPSVS